jgi:hypothetical protein
MPPLGGVRSGGGGVTMVFQPPVEFIVRQSARFRHELEDLSGLWDRFEPLMSDLEERVFSTQGFGQWPALAESTRRQKGSSEIMVETGDLRSSLVDPEGVDVVLARHPKDDVGHPGGGALLRVDRGDARG